MMTVVEKSPGLAPDSGKAALRGPRWELRLGNPDYPQCLLDIPKPPGILYGIGDPSALQEGLAVIGARKATPYGKAVVRKFATIAAQKGIVIISGGARGCDTEAHKSALDVGAKTVVVLGGGCDCLYPESNRGLFQQVIDCGGAVISERSWETPPLPYTFRERNRIIAGLARATLIAEAGLPSGTFSTADDALEANKEVLVVPGAIVSPTSRGANRLIFQGATPIVDEETFENVLSLLFNTLRQETMIPSGDSCEDLLLLALQANPLRMDELMKTNIGEPEGKDKLTWITLRLAELEGKGLVARFPDGRYGPARV